MSAEHHMKKTTTVKARTRKKKRRRRRRGNAVTALNCGDVMKMDIELCTRCEAVIVAGDEFVECDRCLAPHCSDCGEDMFISGCDECFTLLCDDCCRHHLAARHGSGGGVELW